ncbi:MAG: glycosyltransferase family 2 protein [Muribaculaceae bacterium]|nr:glycosyltransferase family 2 protein [Muribaculaceae bacterium]
MVSVIIPAYNAQAYLRECLESVLAQTFPDWEAIVVDDGSTDATLAIAREYSARDRRIKVVSTANGGPSSARNIAMERIVGDWFTFLDSDDMLYPHAMEVMLRSSAGADVVCGGIERGVCPNESRVVPVASAVYRTISGQAALRSGLYQKDVASSVWGKLYRSELLGDERFHDGIYYEDMLFYCDVMFKASQVNIVDSPVYFYRDNPESFINTVTIDRLDVLRVVAMVEDRCRCDERLLRAARDRRLSANFNMYGLLSVHDRNGKYSHVREQCWKIIKEYRFASFADPEVRLKNKVGVLVSCLGGAVLALVSRLVYR